MKNILKFIAIFLSSIILSIIFGYWFGLFNEFLLKLFNLSSGFSTFFVARGMGFLIDGVIISVPFFASLLSRLSVAKTSTRLIFILLGILPTIMIVFSEQISQLIIVLAFLILGLLLGELILFVKKKFFAPRSQK